MNKIYKLIGVTAFSFALSLSLSGSAQANTIAKPTITSLSPVSGPVSSRVLINGYGFSPTGNTVYFGDSVVISNLPSDGYSINFSVPSYTAPACRLSNPPCMIATALINPGVYYIGVRNAEGVLADAANFTVTAQNSVLVGDVDGNGVLDCSDLTKLASLVLNGSAVSFVNDVNYDGVLNVADVQTLTNILIAKGLNCKNGPAVCEHAAPPQSCSYQGGTAPNYCDVKLVCDSVSTRVGQLIVKNKTVYLVGQNGLYGFSDLKTFQSWGYKLSQIVTANEDEQSLAQAGVVPGKDSACTNPVDQIDGKCGSAVLSSSRAGHLIVLNKTVYLVGLTGLYGFPDLAIFQSWGYTFSQIVTANASEKSLNPIGLVPAKQSGCSSPLDQITGNCGVASIATVRSGQLIVLNKTVYLVGQDVLYGFPDLATFQSWGYTFSQIVTANAAEQVLPPSATFVPSRKTGCTNPLDQIAGTCVK
jgi:hypothetical protein